MKNPKGLFCFVGLSGQPVQIEICDSTFLLDVERAEELK